MLIFGSGRAFFITISLDGKRSSGLCYLRCMAAIATVRSLLQEVDLPGSTTCLTWEPGPRTRQRVAWITGSAALAGSVALKTEDEWPLAYWRLSSLSLHLYS
jgi:hypothetical protein